MLKFRAEILILTLVVAARGPAAAGAEGLTQLPSPDRFAPVDFPAPTPPPADLCRAQFSVGDFGAGGDGEANDTTAVNCAIAQCHASGGGTVYFPPGTYRVASV